MLCGDGGWGLVRRATLTVGVWADLEAAGLRAVVTTRHGGVSVGAYESLNLGDHVGDDPERVLVNRARAATAAGLAPSDLVLARQVHGCTVAVVGDADRGRGALPGEAPVADADVLLTDRPGVGLTVLAADCVPVLLWSPEAGWLAVVHAGWRGTAAGAVPAAVAALEDRGAPPATLVAAVGPAIAAERYQVGSEVAGALRAALGVDHEEVLIPDGAGHWRADLVAANLAQLRALGVARAAVAPAATGADGPFYSDRAARPCGRFGLIAALTG